jgi:arabinofuranosyltransferase
MHARLLLPATFAIAMPVAVVSVGLPLRGWHPLSRAATALTCGALLLWAVPVAGWARPHLASTSPLRAHTTPDGTLGDERQTRRDLRTGSLVTPHDSVQTATLRQNARAHQRYVEIRYHYFYSRARFPVAKDSPYGVVFAAAAIGELSYVLGPDVYVEDQYGLAEPVDSRIRLFLAPHRFRPGHEKLVDAAWVLARFAPPDVDPTPVSNRRDVAAARHALQCGQLRVVLRDVHGSLGISELFRNVADSFSNTRLRFWGFPVVAEHELCR